MKKGQGGEAAEEGTEYDMEVWPLHQVALVFETGGGEEGYGEEGRVRRGKFLRSQFPAILEGDLAVYCMDHFVLRGVNPNRIPVEGIQELNLFESKMLPPPAQTYGPKLLEGHNKVREEGNGLSNQGYIEV